MAGSSRLGLVSGLGPRSTVAGSRRSHEGCCRSTMAKGEEGGNFIPWGRGITGEGIRGE